MSVEIGRQESLWVEFAGWVADEQPADRHRRNTAAIPQRSAGCDLDGAIGSAVPETDPIARPGHVAILEDGRELFVGLASNWRAATSFALWSGKFEQVGIEAQAGDDADVLADCGKEFGGRKGAVGDQYDITIGKPAADLPGGLAGPIEQRLGRARFAVIEAFGGGEQREERQRHDAIGPRHAHLQHGRKPAQAAGFDEVPLGGAHRIAIDAAGADLGSLAPLNGVIEPDHHRLAGRHEDLDLQEQQVARRGPRRPRHSVEDSMESTEIAIALPP